MNRKLFFKDVVRIGGAYAAFCIGSGYATGQEILQFFTAFGWAGIGSALITMVLYIWMGMTLIRDGRRYHFKSDQSVWQHYCGKDLGMVVNALGTFLLFGVYVVMISGAGASATQYLGWPELAGRLGMSTVCLVVALMGLKNLVTIIGLIGPVILSLSLMVGFFTIIKDSARFSMAQAVLNAVEVPASCGNWMLSGFLYSGFMALMILPFLAQLGDSAKSKRSGMWGGFAGGFFQVAAILVMLLAQLLNIGDIHDTQIPSLILADRIHPALGGIFVMAVFLGIFSTSVPLLWLLAHKAGPDGSKRYSATTIIVVAAALFLSELPFTVLVNRIYGYSGYLGIFVMAVTFLHQMLAWKREKEGIANTGRRGPFPEEE